MSDISVDLEEQRISKKCSADTELCTVSYNHKKDLINELCSSKFISL